MNSFQSNRRELLRVGTLGLGAVVGSIVPDVHAASHAPSPAPAPGIFDVRTYGAVGDGKTFRFI